LLHTDYTIGKHTFSSFGQSINRPRTLKLTRYSHQKFKTDPSSCHLSPTPTPAASLPIRTQGEIQMSPRGPRKSRTLSTITSSPRRQHLSSPCSLLSIAPTLARKWSARNFSANCGTLQNSRFHNTPVRRRGFARGSVVLKTHSTNWMHLWLRRSKSKSVTLRTKRSWKHVKSRYFSPTRQHSDST
jgi:hypothetical protein